MIKLDRRKKEPVRLSQIAHIPVRCRCGGEPTKPVLVVGCRNRWLIQCQVKNCCARNASQGLNDTIQGWNRLATHFYR
ncbi:MAG: hypothetical protein ACI808_002309 [Paraglaciecola sp.]|jgi:hypothetical protein